MHTPDLSDSFNAKAFSFMSDVAALEEFYSILQEINNPSLQQKIQQAMNKIITPWTQRQDDLIHTLNQVEQSYAALQQNNQAHLTMYLKAIRDLQFYKAKYESIDCNQYSQNLKRWHPFGTDNSSGNKSNSNATTVCTSPLPTKFQFDPRSNLNIDTSSNISVTSSTDYSQYTKSSTPIDDYSSLSSSKSIFPTTSSLQPFTNDNYHQHSNHTSDENYNDKTDPIFSIDQNYPIPFPPQKPPPSNDLPLPPLPVSASPSTNQEKGVTCEQGSFETPPHRVCKKASTIEELKFACGDGFWNTIAKGKSNKAEVDLLVKNYLKKGGQPNVANNSGTIQSVKEGYGLIHALIVIKNTSALQRIIYAGANPHALPLQGVSGNGVKNENNDISPLVLAAQLGYMNGVRLLVERAHANVLSSKGPRQENALLAAIQADAFDVVTYLLHKSHQLLSQADMFGATPLHYACMTGKTKMISFLVRECEQAIDAVCYRGETPLHYAIRHRRTKAVALLVGELGAYPNTYIVKKIPTPLDLAKSKGLRNIAEYLKKMGAKTTKEMEKKSSSVFTCPLPRAELSSDAISEIGHVNLASSNYSVHSGRTSTSNESVII
ncbi:unnamed protein product [Absidia cylindrospora]